MPSSLCPRRLSSIYSLIFALVTLLKCLYVYMDLTCFICCFHVSTSFSLQFSIFSHQNYPLRSIDSLLVTSVFSKLSLYPVDETLRLTSGDRSQRYFADNEMETAPSPLTPVSAEQLFPAGKILQIDERTSCRWKKCACLFIFLWCLVTNVKSDVHIWSIAQTFFWFVTHSFPGLRDGSD